MSHDPEDEDNEVEEEEEEEVVQKPKKARVSKKKKTSDDEDDDDDAPKAKAKKPRKKKDKNAPKGVKSAYTYFGEEHRPALKETGISFGEVSKKLGAMWKEASEEEKQKFQSMAELDKERHKREMEEYNDKKGSDDE